MAFKFRCPICDELFSVKEDMAGAEMICPMCAAKFEVPKAPAASGGKGRRASRDAGEDAPPRPASRQTIHEDERRIEPSAGEPAAGSLDEEEELGLSLPISFRRPRTNHTDELDMTPMVDVTFLLLIFFMVTAAFSLQKSHEMPAPDDTRPSTSPVSLEELELDPKVVIVRIDSYNTFHVGAAAWDAEQEAPSRADLLDKLRHARMAAEQTPTSLLVMASEEAEHGAVVTAMDAGAAVGMQDVKLMTVPAQE